jgi:hypothetical protein
VSIGVESTMCMFSGILKQKAKPDFTGWWWTETYKRVVCGLSLVGNVVMISNRQAQQ